MRSMLLLAAALLTVALVPATPAVAGPAPSWRVSAGGPVATIQRNPTGTLTLAISRGGRTVVEPSPLGIVTERVDLSTGLTFQRRTDRWVVERYRTTVGKRLDRRAAFRESTLRFTGAGGARLDLVVRASRDGIAYRYVLPADHGAVLREASAFTLPADSPAWLALYRRDYENPYVQTTAGGAAAAEYMHPALFEAGGSYALITESDVDGRYSGGRLVHDAGTSTYRIKLWDEKVTVTARSPRPGAPRSSATWPRSSTSTLVDDLAPPSKVRDTSWIKPGAVFWSWLAGGREAGQSLTHAEGVRRLRGGARLAVRAGRRRLVLRPELGLRPERGRRRAGSPN